MTAPHDPADFDRLGDRLAVVTGGAGAIGSNLVPALLAGGVRRIVVVDDLSAGHRWAVPDDERVHLVVGDIADPATLALAFTDSPDLVFHLAAFFANQNSVDHPQDDLATNGVGTLALLETVARHDVDRFVYASSGCSIYGSAAPLPLTEDVTSMHLSSPYQITKMLGELYGNFFLHEHGVPVVHARLFNSYGPGEVPGRYRNVIPNFLHWAGRGEPLPITGTGDETRDFTFVADIVDGLLRCAVVDAAVGEAFNLGSGVETTIAQLATMVNDVTGNEGGIVHRPARHWDTKRRLRASIDRAAATLGYQPTTDIERGIELAQAWFVDHGDEIDRAARF